VRGKNADGSSYCAEYLVEGLEQAARTYWPALLIEGIALILFGILALFIPPLVTLGIATTLGWLFLFGGIAALLVCAWARTAPIIVAIFDNLRAILSSRRR
jgi:uncharacterized membrane protein HdeD (DUF308 family)